MPAAPAPRALLPRTLGAVVHQARFLTGAATGRLLAVAGDRLMVAAVDGVSTTGPGPGEPVEPGRIQAYALAVGQPVALMPQPGDPASAGFGAYPGVPPSILAVACGAPAAGLLELAGKVGVPSFGLDDLTVAGALAAVAAAALDDGADAAVTVGPAHPPPPSPSPDVLAAALGRLAEREPIRYHDLAGLLERLLAPRP